MDISQKKAHKWLINTQTMFNILSHRGTTNQNDTETPSHPSQNGHHQEKKQVLERGESIRDA